MNKKTKIVATVSDKRCDVEFIQSLYEAGMNAVRINSAHVTPESASKIVDNVRQVSEQIAIIIDTKGPEIRLTGMTDEYANGIAVAAGDIVRVMGTDEDLKSTPEVIYMNDASIFNDVPTGAAILIDDGELEMEVVEKKDKTLICQVKNGGVLKPRKSVNVPGVKIDLPSVTEKDRRFIEWAIEKDLDFIAHSFVRKKEDVMEVKRIIKAHNSPIRIISKIENREGVDNIDEILEATYGVMVARGDLGVEIPAEQIPITQRYIVKKCIESKTPVIIATQMLHSMISNPRPTRAEVSDIASAIYQRVDAVMLSGETANGDYPVEAVSTMARVAVEIERDTINNAPNLDLNMVRINNEITAQLSRSAVRACQNLPVKAIVIDTLSGRTGRYLSAFRGQKPVYAVCYRKSVMRQLAISYGVYAIHREPAENHDSFLLSILYYLEDKKWLYKEDLIVVIGGSFGAAKGASFMEIGNVLNLEHKALNLR
ncbi:pyruvate kinase [Gallalistipes aquisgranensis]|uniref:pyruvate kinase n=1 Tax=Gallalistipes aquisgranensis TaxID=2779358 RepID=UPI001CF86B44|nr:pyruvate kinase [Gallalistipes aquisgranensis]MBE5033368.1 pyruvate kinase [Gallalistipes aquisgranensis]